MKKIKISALLLAVVLLVGGMTVSAQEYATDISFDSYTYDLNYNPVKISAPYIAEKVFTGNLAGCGDFSGITDICVDGRRLFVVDSGNNRIVVLNDSFETVSVFNGNADWRFNNPSGACIKDDTLYIADTGNKRIVLIDKNSGELKQVLERPAIKLLDEDYNYEPSKLAVDTAGRLYVLANGITSGIIYLEADGSFIGFLGAPEVTTNALDMLWRKFMTEKQIAQTYKNIPTEYNSIFMDSKCFMYVTSKSNDIPPISRLNSQGTNVLRSAGEAPSGDGWYTGGTATNKSLFIDIAARDDGTYFALDNNKGRVFTYSKSGELLYAFGAIGSQKGTVYSPIALSLMEDRVIVADYSTGDITVYSQTNFGKQIDEAQRFYSSGDYDKAYTLWEEVSDSCPNYYPATIAKAKIMLSRGNYTDAMKRLKALGETKYYSEAFKEYRSATVRRLFYPLILAVIIAAVVVVLWKKLKNKIPIVARYEQTVFYQEYRFISRCMFHPFDGFGDVKREGRGSKRTATVVLLLFIFCYALRAQYSGYLILGYVPDSTDTLFAVLKILLPLILWCVANWCFTSLMDGKGKMSDIYIVTAYALKPYVIFSIPLLVLSNCVSLDEAFIYSSLDMIITVWCLMLIFFGMITIHDYSLSKGIVTAVLTIVGICLILFLAVVFFDQLQVMVDFIKGIFREISLRFNS
ncbi:MAG: DUF1282 family protein [Clostridia bacterium]|nr:DUF1282 family protein [Clostridia bacterium]